MFSFLFSHSSDLLFCPVQTLTSIFPLHSSLLSTPGGEFVASAVVAPPEKKKRKKKKLWNHNDNLRSYNFLDFLLSFACHPHRSVCRSREAHLIMEIDIQRYCRLGFGSENIWKSSADYCSPEDSRWQRRPPGERVRQQTATDERRGKSRKRQNKRLKRREVVKKRENRGARVWTARAFTGSVIELEITLYLNLTANFYSPLHLSFTAFITLALVFLPVFLSCFLVHMKATGSSAPRLWILNSCFSTFV